MAGYGQKLGLTKAGYGHYEHGLHPFTADLLTRISTILDRPVQYFLGADTDRTPDEEHVLALYRRARGNGRGELALKLLRSLSEGR